MSEVYPVNRLLKTTREKTVVGLIFGLQPIVIIIILLFFGRIDDANP
ncbi:MAG: hypothetical protein NO474_05540 [Methanomassiliicoccales archaeon]|nr:hypothetical protein [Methanomassiliicoccales archaeon]